MGKGPLLSICIPTMNRAGFLADALASIESQLGGVDSDELELCVYDSGSDNSDKIVGGFSKKTGIAVKYERNPEKIGVDRSIIKVTLMGSGRFCWLLGDDDIAEKGGIAALLSAIRMHPGASIILLNKFSYSVDLKEKWKGAPPTGSGKYAQDRLFEGKGGAAEFLSYFFYDLSYMSAQVVNRELYGQALDEEKDIGAYCEDYALCYVVCKMLIKNPSAYFIAAPCVGNRTGNETTLSVKSEEGGGGSIARLDRASGENFKKIADNVVLQYDAAAYRKIIGYLMKYHMRSQLMSLKASSVSLGKRMVIWRRVVSLYWRLPEFWAYCAPFIAMPQVAFFALRRINRSIVKKAARI